MAEESVAEGVLARLEEGEDIGDALRDDIERREGVFFREWMRTTDGWQGIATPAGGAATAEEPPPRRVRRDDPDLNILIYVISDYGHDREDDEVGGQAYVRLIKSTFSKSKIHTWNLNKLYDDKWSDTSVGGFGADFKTISQVYGGVSYDQIHFSGHGRPIDGMTFFDKPFDCEKAKKDITSLPLKSNGVVILSGCFTNFGPFYDWALEMVDGDDKRLWACSGEFVYDWAYVEEFGKSTGETEWEDNEDLTDIYGFLGIEDEE